MAAGKLFRVTYHVQQNKVLLMVHQHGEHRHNLSQHSADTKMRDGFLRLCSRKFSNIAHDPSSSLAFVLTLLYPQIQPMNAPVYARKQQKDDKLKTGFRPLVVVLAYDGLCTFEFGVAVEIFGLSRPELGDAWYRFAVAGIDAGELRATGGIRIMTDGDISLLASADRIIIPGWRGLDSPVPGCALRRITPGQRARVSVAVHLLRCLCAGRFRPA
jgi:hypothetical protein